MPKKIQVDVITKEKGSKQAAAQVKKNLDSVKSSGKSMTDGISGGNKSLISSFGKVAVAIGVVTVAIKTMGKAYDAAKMGAQLQQQANAFSNLSASFGVSSTNIINGLRQVSGESISTASLINSAGKAMLLDIAPEKLQELMRIARATSRITGQTVTQAFDDITVAVGRQSKMILDNLGIVFRLDDAYKNYADSLGKTVSQLTEAEKKQAFLNETIRKGSDFAERIGGGETAAEGFEALGAAAKNLGDSIKKSLVPAFEPLIKGLTSIINKFDSLYKSIGRATGALAPETAEQVAPLEVKPPKGLTAPGHKLFAGPKSTAEELDKLNKVFREFERLEKERTRVLNEIWQLRFGKMRMMNETSIQALKNYGAKVQTQIDEQVKQIKEFIDSGKLIRKQVNEQGGEVVTGRITTEQKAAAKKEIEEKNAAEIKAINDKLADDVIRDIDKLLAAETQKAQDIGELAVLEQKYKEEAQEKHQKFMDKVRADALAKEQRMLEESMSQLDEALAEQERKAKEHREKEQKAWEDMWKRIGDIMQDSLGNAFENLIFEAKSFREVMAGMLNQLSRQLFRFAFDMLATKARAGIPTAPSTTSGGGIGGGLGGLGGVITGIGGAIGGLFGFRDGGILPKAQGGNVFNGPTSGYPIMAHGNEAVIPLKNGAVPVMLSGGGGGGNTFVVNVQTQNRGANADEQNRNLAKDITNQMKLLIRQEMMDQRRTGGMLNTSSMRTI